MATATKWREVDLTEAEWMQVDPLTFMAECHAAMLKLRRRDLTATQAEAAGKYASLALLYNDHPVVQTYAERLIAEVNEYVADLEAPNAK